MGFMMHHQCWEMHTALPDDDDAGAPELLAAIPDVCLELISECLYSASLVNLERTSRQWRSKYV